MSKADFSGAEMTDMSGNPMTAQEDKEEGGRHATKPSEDFNALADDIGRRRYMKVQKSFRLWN